MRTMPLDRIDRRILTLLQQDCSLTNLRLSEQVGLSPPACLKRVQRLRTHGYLVREVALVDPDRFGPMLHIVVEVSMERDRKDLYQQFLKRALSHAAVKQCYQVTGETDFVLIVVVPTMDAYDLFCDQVLYADANMRKFRTMVSRFRNKFDTSIDVGAAPAGA